jgi:WD40 repeat protein
MNIIRVGKSHIDDLVVLSDNRFACIHNGVITIWDATTETQIAKLNKQKDAVLCIKRMLDGNLVGGCSDKTIRIWSTTDYTCIKTLTNIPASACVIEPLPNNRLACMCHEYVRDDIGMQCTRGARDKLLIWCLETDKEITSFECCSRIQYSGLRTFPNGLLCIPSNVFTNSFYDTTTLTKAYDAPLEFPLFYFRDDIYIAIKGYPHREELYTLFAKTIAGDTIHSVKAGEKYGILDVCVLRDGRIITSGTDTTIQEWSLDNTGFHLINSYKVANDCRRHGSKRLIQLDDGRLACGTRYGEICVITL